LVHVVGLDEIEPLSVNHLFGIRGINGLQVSDVGGDNGILCSPLCLNFGWMVVLYHNVGSYLVIMVAGESPSPHYP